MGWSDDADVAFLELSRREGSTHVSNLVEGIENEFKGYYERFLKRVAGSLSSKDRETAIKLYQSEEDERRSQLMQKATEMLCEKRRRKDIKILRKGATSDLLADPSPIFEYLSHFGRSSDVPLIIDVYKKRAPAFSWDKTDPSERMRREAAHAIARLSQGNAPKILAMEMPPALLAQVIHEITLSELKALDNEVFMKLFKNGNIDVRRAAAIQALRALTKKKVSTLLKTYLELVYRHYNVIHWLDLGHSAGSRLTKTVLKNSNLS